MSLVDVHTEWDPLEEIVVGTMRGARQPLAGADVHAIEYADLEDPLSIPTGPYDRSIVSQTNDELDELAETLSARGVVVRRPGERDLSATFSTVDWSSDGYYDYCPRDGFLAIGNTILESPMVFRSRLFEGNAYRSLFTEYLLSGSAWASAPKPLLRDELFDRTRQMGKRLGNDEPVFDAANILRFGTDIFYLVSDSGNDLGAIWLQNFLGDKYIVHACPGLYASTHVDSTLVALKPGLLLVNPSRVTDENLPDFLSDWDRIECPDPVDIGFSGDYAKASVWIAMNLLSVGPDLAVVDRRQPKLISLLESHGIETIPLQLTHARTLGGGFHCVTLDVRRAGALSTYR